MNNSLSSLSASTEHFLSQRHNTATLAAISLVENEVDENEEQEETSIDAILGVRNLSPSEDLSSTGASSPDPDPDAVDSDTRSSVHSPEETETGTGMDNDKNNTRTETSSDDNTGMGTLSDDRTGTEMGTSSNSTETGTAVESSGPAEMATEETTECSQSADGETTVITSVTVPIHGEESAENSPGREKKMENENGRSQDGQDHLTEGEGRLDKEKSRSTEVLINDVDENSTITVTLNLNGYDSDDTLSDEESHEDLAHVDNTSSKSSSPPAAPAGGEASPKGSPPAKRESSSPSNSSPKSSLSTIIIKEDRTGSNESMDKLTPPTDQRRRCKSLFFHVA